MNVPEQNVFEEVLSNLVDLVSNFGNLIKNLTKNSNEIYKSKFFDIKAKFQENNNADQKEGLKPK